MSFLFKVRAGRVCWAACGVAAVLCMAAAPAAAQEFFSSPGDKQRPRPLPWEERGLRAALADPSPEVRTHAVQHIISEGWARILLTAKDLEPLLQSPDEEIKKQATNALARLSAKPDPSPPEGAEAQKEAPEKIAPERVSRLLTQLHDPRFYERENAVKALGRARTRATPQIVSALVPLLQDPDFGVVIGTVQALWSMEREEDACRKALLRLLKAQDSGPQDIFPAKASAMQARHDAVYMLIHGGPGKLYTEGIPFILPLFTDPEYYVREAVVDCLWKVGPRLVPYLKDLLPLLQDDSNPMVQHLAARALSSVGDEAAPTVARALLPLLQSKDPNLPLTVIHSLGELGPAAAPVALPALLPFLKKKNDACRLCAVVALGRMGPAAAPAARELLAVLDDPDTRGLGHFGNFSQHTAAEALGQLGPSVVPLVVPALAQHFKDGDYRMNEAILRAFECLGAAAAPLIIPAALPLLQSTDGWTQSWICDALKPWGNFTRDPAWQCAALAGAAAAADDKHLQSFRLFLYLWSGHDPELLLSVRWLGRPADPLPAKGAALSAQDQRAVLGMLLKLWPHSAAYPAVRREIAQRSGDVAQSITAAPDEEVAAFLTRLGASLKADECKETRPASSAARSAVERALARSAEKK
jgi:HEAT repeat protein